MADVHCSLEDPLAPELHAPQPGTGKSFGVRGYLCCAGVVISWVGQSEVCQAVQVHGYNKPMAITWLNHSVAILVLPCILLGGGSLQGCWTALTGSVTGGGSTQRGRAKQLLLSTFALATVYLFSDWFWYIGLPETSVAAGTAIFNTSPCMVYVLSVLMGQPCRRWQTAAVLASVLGVVIVCSKPGENLAVSTPESQDNKLLGNAFVLLAAAGYAIYEVFLDRALASNATSGTDMLATSAFVSLSGLMTALLLWPVVACLGAPSMPAVVAESPDWPSSSATLGLCINAMLATSFNILLALCVVATSPLITSVACMLTIPTSLVVDAVVHGDNFGLFELAGSLCIILGFSLLVLDQRRQN